MLSLEDETMLADFTKAEAAEPRPRKIISGSRSIYKSRRFRPPTAQNYGLPVLCDLGNAKIGRIHESGPFVQPHIYRAPEINFEMPWGPPIDIWNLGCLVRTAPAASVRAAPSLTLGNQIWDLFEGDHLFADIFDERGCHDAFKHLALMVALIGPPPKRFVQRSETTEQCFDPNGRPSALWLGPVPVVAQAD